MWHAARGAIAVAAVIATLWAFAYVVVFAFDLGLPSPPFLEDVVIVWPQIILFAPNTFESMLFWVIAGVGLGLLVRPRSRVALFVFATIYVVILIVLLPFAIQFLGGTIRVELP